MIGSGLKKLARENGMTIAHGVAYGSLQGYAATLSEGAGYKLLSITGKIADPGILSSALGKVNLREMYRVMDWYVFPDAISVKFLDNPGTMSKIRAFIPWFIARLQENGVETMNTCPGCGCEVGQGRWVLINGIAYHMHEACKEKAVREVQDANHEEKENRTGSYGTGAVGAVIGALLGAVVWAIVLRAGYVASVVGLLIGWLAEKGYTLLKGKIGKAKVIILAAAVILGVVVGTYGALVFETIELINDGTFAGLAVSEAPGFVLDLLEFSPELRSEVITNVLMGLVFAGLGVYTILKKAGAEASGSKVIELQ